MVQRYIIIDFRRNSRYFYTIPTAIDTFDTAGVIFWDWQDVFLPR